MVLAKVGDRTITLGDYAAAIDRMDDFDRLRYRSVERRRELLTEIIKVELLAQEAERRGLDKEPQAQVSYRTLLREALLRDARKNARSAAEFTAEEVRAYYDANKEQYIEPERRRLSHIVVNDREQAEQLLAQAKSTTDIEAWGKLVLEHSDQYKANRAENAKPFAGPVETAGDLGLVGPPGDVRSANSQVDESLRVALFRMANIDDISDQVIQDKSGQFHIVRLTGITRAHTRSLEESERTIRTLMAEQDMRAREQQLEDDLRKKYPVTIDETALAQAKAPSMRLHAPPENQRNPAQKPEPDPSEHDHEH